MTSDGGRGTADWRPVLGRQLVEMAVWVVEDSEENVGQVVERVELPGGTARQDGGEVGQVLTEVLAPRRR